MFDEVISHYKPLGERFTGKYLQTKSLDNIMSNYWISPAGELFKEDLADSMEIVEVESVDEDVFPWVWMPTGKNKKLSPVYHNGSVIVYPGHDDDKEYIEACLLFKDGKIIDYQIYE